MFAAPLHARSPAKVPRPPTRRPGHPDQKRTVSINSTTWRMDGGPSPLIAHQREAHSRTRHVGPELGEETTQEHRKGSREEADRWATIVTNIKQMLVAAR